MAQQAVSSDEITFHLGGKAKRQNIPYTGIQNPHYVTDHARLSPNVNVCYTNLMSLVLLFHYLLLNMFRMLVHPS